MGIDPVGVNESNIHSFNRYAYANNNPIKFVDPDGRYADLAIEALSIGLGLASFDSNWQQGNYGSAAVDALGVGVDMFLAALPGAPGAVGLGIKAVRGTGDEVAEAIVKNADVTKKIHGNDLDNPNPTQGYSLRDRDTGEVLKYGETTRGEKRYTKKYLKENNARMEFEVSGTKRDMHNWQHEKILEHKSSNAGDRPRLNKSDY